MTQKEELKKLTKEILEMKVESAKDKGRIRILESKLNLETQERKNDIEDIRQALKESSVSKISKFLEKEGKNTLLLDKELGIWPF